MKTNWKSKLVVPSGSLLALTAKANMWLIVSVTVLVVGGIIIYSLWSFCKTNLPVNQTTNSVSSASNYLIKNDAATNGTYLYEQYGGISPYTVFYVGPFIPQIQPPNPDKMQPMDTTNPPAPPFFMTLQSGLDALSTPWVSAGTNQPTNQNVNLQTLVDNSNEYSIAITVGSQTLFYSTTNPVADNNWENFDYTAGSTNVLTDNGDVCILVTNTPCPVVIERSTDWLAWVPVFTNTATAGGPAQNFTDTNAPPDHAFYRVFIPDE